MKILGCVRPQNNVKVKDDISPTDAKTKEQTYKIAYDNKPGFLKRLFSRTKTDENIRLTDTRV